VLFSRLTVYKHKRTLAAAVVLARPCSCAHHRRHGVRRGTYSVLSPAAACSRKAALPRARASLLFPLAVEARSFARARATVRLHSHVWCAGSGHRARQARAPRRRAFRATRWLRLHRGGCQLLLSRVLLRGRGGVFRAPVGRRGARRGGELGAQRGSRVGVPRRGAWTLYH